MTYRRAIALSWILFACIIGLPSAAGAALNKDKLPKLDTKLSKLVSSGSTTSQRVIIRSAPGARAATKTKVKSLGGTTRSELAGINAVVADLRASALSGLTTDASVLSVSVDAPVKAAAAPAAAPYTLEATLGVATLP